MVKYRQILVEESKILKNRLHGLLFNQYGQSLGIFSSLFSKVSLAFFSRYSNPSMLENICPDNLADFLKAIPEEDMAKRKRKPYC